MAPGDSTIQQFLPKYWAAVFSAPDLRGMNLLFFFFPHSLLVLQAARKLLSTLLTTITAPGNRLLSVRYFELKIVSQLIFRPMRT